MKKLILSLALAFSPLAGLAQDDISQNVDITKKTCDDKQSFFLRNSIVDSQIGAELKFCKTFSSAKPAMFTFSNNGISNTWKLSSDAALGFVLKRPSDAGVLASVFPNLAYSTLVAFAEIDGSRDSTGTSSGTARVGLSYEALFQGNGNALAYSILDVVPYYQTDLNGDASGYGLQLSYVPAFDKINHNAIVDNTVDPVLFYTTSAFTIDAFRSDDPGTTALGANQNYLWVGADLGANVEFRNKKRKVAEASLNLSHFYDTESKQEATLGVAALSFPMADDGIASLNFTYTRGRSRRDLVKVDEFEVGLGIKF